MSRRTQRSKTRNWPQILRELDQAGVCCAEVGRRLEIAASTVQYWKRGGEPRHSDGERLLELLHVVKNPHAEESTSVQMSQLEELPENHGS